jgi:DnaJ-domain-containing protein 1
VILIISILLYFFITALGILKGAEKKTVYFFTKKDYKIVLITGIASLAGIFIIFLFLSKSILLAGLTGFIFWAIIFILINIIWSYRLNPKMHIIPAIVGFSRSSVVFFIPIMEYIASVFAKDKTFIEREGEEFNETLKRLDAHPSLKLQISWTTLVFIHGPLINGNYVELARIIKSSERPPKAFEELKKQTGKAKTPEKDSNSNLGGGPDRSTADEGEYTYNSQDSVSDINLESDVVSAYEIIGISESASDEEVKTAYRKKIMEYHPDRTGGLGDKLKDVAEEETKKLNNAYDKIMKSRGH